MTEAQWSRLAPLMPPQRPHDRRHHLVDRAVYRELNRVERLFNRLKQQRRVATRYEKRVAHYHAMLVLVAILIWL